jgi:hypothetical protein
MQKGHPRYVCTLAFDGNDHPWPKSVSESLILDWVKDEAALLMLPDVVETDAPNTERVALMARLDALSRQHEMGVLSDADLMARAREVQDALDRLEPETVPIDLTGEGIDWDHDAPEEVNRLLRALWYHVQLDDDLRPVRAEWRVPQWRAQDVAESPEPNHIM